jgi:hypothetical protein
MGEKVTNCTHLDNEFCGVARTKRDWQSTYLTKLKKKKKTPIMASALGTGKIKNICISYVWVGFDT